MTTSARIPLVVALFLSLSFIGCASTHARDTREGSVVTLEQDGDRFTLLKNGEPHIIRGVSGSTNLPLLKKRGGNTIRTWDAEGIDDTLDEAHELGISVVVGIWIAHQRHGYDHSDPAQRQAQLDRVEKFVTMYKDHPAVLAWGVGNEIELGGDLDIAIEQIREASALIKKLDPNHPTMAVVAGLGEDKAKRIQDECPDIDFLGVNAYGSMGSVPDDLRKQGYTGAYAMTEYGVVGHWETHNMSWGAPVEQSSHEKAEFMREVYDKAITSQLGEQCLGGFAFLWGQKQERTPTWYGLLLKSGEATERVDVLEELWTGEAPENRAPTVKGIRLMGRGEPIYEPGQRVLVVLEAQEPDADVMDIQWELLPESTATTTGGDFEDAIKPLNVYIEKDTMRRYFVTMPREEGAYRIFVTVRDGQGHAGTANMPLYVGTP